MAKTHIVSYSELDSYRQCAMKHKLAYVERWTTDDVAPALSRGKLFHSVMEAHYNTLLDAHPLRPDAESIWTAVGPFLADPMTGAQTAEQELVEWIYRGYVECYTLDPDWEIVGVEYAVDTWLPTERGTRSSIRLKGKVDLLVRDLTAGGGLWTVDHKTCKNLPKQRELDLDDQMAIYTYLLRRQGLDIRGTIYNACRTERLKTREMGMDERFKRHLTVRSEQELETMALEAMQQMRHAHSPANKAPRSPNPDTCRWRCSFTEPCLMARKGADLEKLMHDFGFRVDLTRH